MTISLEEQARVIADMFLAGDEPIRSQIADVVAILASIRESERAACEAIAREGSFPFDIDVWLNATKKEMTAHVALAIANRLAARKGKGEGK